MKTLVVVDLFGDEVKVQISEARSGRKPTQPKGYAAQPGTGPAGETCRTCRHKCAPTSTNRVYWKCRLMQAVWTGGPGTDIRMRAPACNRWEKIEGSEK